MSDLITESDKRLVRNAYTDPTLGPSIRSTRKFELAEVRLAKQNLVWSPELLDFVAAS